MLSKHFAPSEKLHIGVLLAPPPVQLLDLAPVDLFHMLSEEYLGSITMLPQAIRKLALRDLQISYIAHDVSEYDSTSNSGSSDGRIRSAPLTANASIGITSSLKDSGVQPGQLSILVIPGPDPNVMPAEQYRSFIAAHAQSGMTDIITICTGIYPACYSGICDGRIVSGPRGLTPDLKAKFSRVKAFEDKRWSKDLLGNKAIEKASGQRRAEIWTAGGITNGQDCIAAYMKEHFDLELADIICRMADVGDRGQEYATGQFQENVWWISRILRSIVRGLWK